MLRKLRNSFRLGHSHDNKVFSRIERSRIVSSNQVLDELTCDICDQIFADPLITSCCSKIYCKECITKWISNYNKCPNGGHNLDSDYLRIAPQNVFNKLKNIPVKCENYENGCQVITTIDKLSKHLKKCDKSANNSNKDVHDHYTSKDNKKNIFLKNEKTDQICRTLESEQKTSESENNALKLKVTQLEHKLELKNRIIERLNKEIDEMNSEIDENHQKVAKVLRRVRSFKSKDIGNGQVSSRDSF